MNESYLYSDFNSYYETKSSVRKEKSGTKHRGKILTILVGILTAVLLIEALLYLVIIPATADVKASFIGLKSLDAEKLGQGLALHCGTQWLGFDTAAAVAHLGANAAVESVSVEKRFPDRVLINIKERVPVAASLVTVNGKTVPVQIDKNGILFALDAAIPAFSIPLVTGFSLDAASDGTRLESKYRSLMEQISAIQAINPVYFSAISEIRVITKEYENYELVLYPIHSRTRVLTDRNLDEKSLQYMMVILDVVNSIDPNVFEVDLRYGSVSYKIHS